MNINDRPFDEVYPENYYTPRLQAGSMRKDKIIADAIYDILEPSSVVDCGCAVATELYWLKQRGVEVKGLDASSYAIKHSLIDEIEQWDLRRKYPFKRRYDICMCFDTIEHIPPKYESIILENLVSASDTVLISVPWMIGDKLHGNEQPPEYWMFRFHTLGYPFDVGLTLDLKMAMRGGKGWVVKNLQVFKKVKE